MSFYDEEGCCLTCPEAHPGCLCYRCKCRRCDDYESDEEGGHCMIRRESSWLSWQDYEYEAQHKQKLAIERFKGTPVRLSALFSNGTVQRRVNYVGPLDIPSRIHVDLAKKEKERFNVRWKTATLLLKDVIVCKEGA